MSKFSLRRHPRYAIGLFAAGSIASALGIVFSEFWIIFFGVLPIIFAGLLLINPFIVITDRHVELHNLFGMAQVQHQHDGIRSLTIQNDTLHLRRGDLRAPLPQATKKRLHPRDWTLLQSQLGN